MLEQEYLDLTETHRAELIRIARAKGAGDNAEDAVQKLVTRAWTNGVWARNDAPAMLRVLRRGAAVNALAEFRQFTRFRNLQKEVAVAAFIGQRGRQTTPPKRGGKRMKFRSSGGGDFVKFDKVGDGVHGFVESVGSAQNKFNGGVDTIITIKESTGRVLKVRCDKKALRDAAADVMANGGFRVGEPISVVLEGVYDSKQYGKGKGKDITIDLPGRDGSAPPATPPATTTSVTLALDPQVQAAYISLEKAKGEESAKTILAAVQSVAKGDVPKQVELLAKAAA